ncbi:cytochrome C oxidase Cbb3 [Paramagnetospirillum kuznetsovii]|uniref:Cytochrome C oxidase Cbb3 n=1 Tax=Paramagnetospirillum kuznetsovii TaxID=2053833 RepID=A0A364P234_9PROT|nr:cytochrome D1 domain-containing protein [Paramagnetospirillum kuznetsovii]RAU23409.1 cytochrome C oxidase Cbb3 [Paramagnetospirillum kuznetsovii]
MKSALIALALLIATPALAAEDAPRLFSEHCAACHGGDRLGAIGPALLPENLGRLKKAEAEKVIAEGRIATQMPGHADKLTPAQIKALADYVFTPLASVPTWGMEQIAASRVLNVNPDLLPAKPVWTADPLNLFTVVETGDHHVTILDGDSFTPLARFQSRFALHGGAKYSPDGRFVYLASRDGWITKYDLYTLQIVAEIRAGVNTRNVAVSHDGRFLMVGNMLPHTLVALDARDLSPIQVIPVAGDKGVTSRVSAVYTAPPRSSFVVALKDIMEVWEIPYADDAGPVMNGFVHSYEKGHEEGISEGGRFQAIRIRTPDYLDDFFFDSTYERAMGASRDGTKGLVVDLDIKRKVAEIDLPGMPHLGSGIIFKMDGRDVMATPHLKEAVVSVIDMQTWKTIKRIPTLGPGFFMRGHENSPYAWIDVSMGKDKDAIQIIDLGSLGIVKTLRPAPGKTTAHAEFDRSGKHVLISVMEADGALIEFDAASFDEVARLPMKRPVGKYNVFNKINYSSGTSH